MAVLVHIDARQRGDGAAVTLRAASVDDPAVCMSGGETWWPALAKLPRLRYDLFDGGLEAQIDTPSSSLTLQTEPWPNFGSYALADARIRISTGDAAAGWTLRFDGRVSAEPKVRDGAAEIAFTVDDRWLDKPLLDTYEGTTGLEGPAALKGQPKPLALGAPRYVPGVLIDPIDSIFQLSDGPIEAVEAALERLARLDGPVADYADLPALRAAAIPAGSFATAKAVGLVRLGAPPTGQMSFHIRGSNAGGWARRPGALIRRLATIAGRPDAFDAAAAAALDAARPYDCSRYLGDQVTARDLIQRLAASVNAVAGVSWLGKLFVAPVAYAEPSLTLAVDGTALPPVRRCETIDIAPPFAKLAITAEQTWTVHPLSEVAFAAQLIDRGAYDALEQYREGHIVSLPDGSQWLYVGEASSTGVRPGPSVPLWRLFRAATSVIPPTTIIGGTVNPATGEVVGGKPASELIELGGGARVFFQNDEPPSPPAKLNDLWLEEDTGKAYVFLGDGDLEELAIGADDLEVIYVGGEPVFFGRAGGWVLTKLSGAVSAGGNVYYLQEDAPASPNLGDSWFQPSTGVLSRWSGTTWAPTADRTAQVVPTIAGIVTVQIAASSAGVTTTPLPKSIRLKAMEGATDRSPAATFTLGALPGGLIASINDVGGSPDRGLLTITRADAGGPIPVTVAFPGGGVRTDVVTVHRTVAPQDSTGNTGGSGGAGTGATEVSARNWYDPIDATHSIVTPILTIRTGAAGKLTFSANATFTGGDQAFANVAIKMSYRAIGVSSWTDVAAEEAGTGAFGDTEPGSVYLSDISEDGLTANTDYEVALFARRTSNRLIYWGEAVFSVRAS